MLDLRDIHKRFAPDKAVLRGVSLTVAPREIVCLLGPSGCGKSTLLRIIAGLERVDHGQVLLDGVDVSKLPAYKRDVGLMFQDYALFPHLNVTENVAYGLRMKNLPASQRRERVDAMLALVNLQGYANRAVDDLSGGEQQRVALARTLAPNPSLLLLDEPVANLDRLLREELVGELRRILKQLHLTTIFVTHDQEEAFALADRVIVMRAGQIEQAATPAQLYRQPANTFVASFLGFDNLLPAARSELELGIARTPAGDFPLSMRPKQPIGDCRLLIPPDAAVLADAATLDGAVTTDGAPPGPTYVRFAARVLATTFRGSFFRLEVASLYGDDAQRLRFEFRTRGRGHLFDPGTIITLWLDSAQMVLVAEG